MALRDPASLDLPNLAKYLRELAAFCERVLASHEAWRLSLPKEGHRNSDCGACRKRRWRADQKKRALRRAAERAT